MRQEKITLLSLAILFPVVLGIIIAGWIVLKDQDAQLSILKKGQMSTKEELNNLGDSLERMGSQLQANARDLEGLENILNDNQIKNREISLRINELSNGLDTLRTNHEDIAARINALGQGEVASRGEQIKRIELGEVSIEKGFTQDIKNNSEE